MRGVFIHQQLEYRVEMPKDGAVQGDTLPTTFSVKSHSAAPQTLDKLILELTFGDLKKLKAGEGKYDTISAATVDAPWTIAPGEQKSVTWSFALDRNSPISSKSDSPFFRFGAEPGICTQVPVSVLSHPHVRAIYEILETSFQFILQGEKWSKGWVEAKFKPSSSKRFSMVNGLTLGSRFVEQGLELKFKFAVKKFEGADANAVKIGKGATDVIKRLEESEYLLSGGFINHTAIEKTLAEALEVVASGF